jgi:hypothetical protein
MARYKDKIVQFRIQSGEYADLLNAVLVGRHGASVSDKIRAGLQYLWKEALLMKGAPRSEAPQPLFTKVSPIATTPTPPFTPRKLLVGTGHTIKNGKPVKKRPAKK